METKISDAQIEVWEAKEKLYEALKNIPEGKKLEFLNQMAKDVIEKYFKDKVVTFIKAQIRLKIFLRKIFLLQIVHIDASKVESLKYFTISDFIT